MIPHAASFDIVHRRRSSEQCVSVRRCLAVPWSTQYGLRHSPGARHRRCRIQLVTGIKKPHIKKSYKDIGSGELRKRIRRAHPGQETSTYVQPLPYTLYREGDQTVSCSILVHAAQGRGAPHGLPRAGGRAAPGPQGSWVLLEPKP